MSTADYEIHVDRQTLESLFYGREESGAFGEEASDIDKMIAEELGSPRRRRRKKTKVKVKKV